MASILATFFIVFFTDLACLGYISVNVAESNIFYYTKMCVLTVWDLNNK